jgi:protein-S-isoprenylcysteine O-methyltransferase Ste14
MQVVAGHKERRLSRLGVQLIVIAISFLGCLALIPGPDEHGRLRIPGASGRILTFLGIGCLVCPWIAAPFFGQPRFSGVLGTTCIVLGLVCLAAGVAVYVVSLRSLRPAFRRSYSEFTPSRLISTGPYATVRHPMYLSLLMIVVGLSLSQRACCTLLLVPIFYLELRVALHYEEKVILRQRFPSAYVTYKAKVPDALMGLYAGIGVILAYAILSGITVWSLLRFSTTFPVE